MKTSYLIRNTPWMNDSERRIARYTARRAEQTLQARGTTPNALHATVLHTLVTARALHQRAQERLALALAEGTATETLAAVIVHTQEACLRVEGEVDALLNPPPAPIHVPSEIPRAATANEAAEAQPVAALPTPTPAPTTEQQPAAPPTRTKTTLELVRERLAAQRNASEATATSATPQQALATPGLPQRG